MKVEEIRHIELDDLADIDAQSRGEVLAEANALFDYTGHSFRASGPLASALVKLGIAPLNTDDVNRYMASKNSSFSFHTGWLFGPMWMFLSFLPITFFAWMGWAEANNWRVGVFSASIILTVASSIALVGCFSEDVFPRYTRTREWRHYLLYGPHKYDMKKYTRYIPLFALNYAVQVAKELPQASIGVYELTTETHVTRPDPDPFLEVALGAEHYFVAVWSEREFEKKL